jgi:hypothetical protein
MTDSRAGLFSELRSLLAKHASELTVVKDQDDAYELNAGVYPKTGKPLFFGAVQLRKNYAAYHLMPLYVFPDLLDGISPELQRRMHGKSCFNFKEINEALRAELESLTAKGLEKYRSEGLL